MNMKEKKSNHIQCFFNISCFSYVNLFPFNITVTYETTITVTKIINNSSQEQEGFHINIKQNLIKLLVT